MATSIADNRYQEGKWVSSGHKVFAGLKPEIILEPKRTALFIVDMQNGFRLPDAPILQRLKQVSPEDYDYFMERLKTVVPNLQKLQDFFRSNNLEVIQCVSCSLTKDGRDRGDRSLRNFHHFTPGAREVQIQEELTPTPDELVFTKTCASIFSGHNTYSVLKRMGIDYLVFGGCVTDGCVQATVLGAADLFGPSKIVVVEDGCIAFSEPDHVGAIRQMGGLNLISSADSVITHLTEQIAASTVSVR